MDLILIFNIFLIFLTGSVDGLFIVERIIYYFTNDNDKYYRKSLSKYIWGLVILVNIGFMLQMYNFYNEYYL